MFLKNRTFSVEISVFKTSSIWHFCSLICFLHRLIWVSAMQVKEDVFSLLRWFQSFFSLTFFKQKTNDKWGIFQHIPKVKSKLGLQHSFPFLSKLKIIVFSLSFGMITARLNQILGIIYQFSKIKNFVILSLFRFLALRRKKVNAFRCCKTTRKQRFISF